MDKRVKSEYLRYLDGELRKTAIQITADAGLLRKLKGFDAIVDAAMLAADGCSAVIFTLGEIRKKSVKTVSREISFAVRHSPDIACRFAEKASASYIIALLTQKFCDDAIVV